MAGNAAGPGTERTIQNREAKKIPSCHFGMRGFSYKYEAAASYSPTQFARAVPSAQRSLTTVFGMGTGVASSP